MGTSEFKKEEDIYFAQDDIKTGLKVAYLWQFGFFSLQPQLPKTAQDWKFKISTFSLEITVRTRLSR